MAGEATKPRAGFSVGLYQNCGVLTISGMLLHSGFGMCERHTVLLSPAVLAHVRSSSCIAVPGFLLLFPVVWLLWYGGTS